MLPICCVVVLLILILGKLDLFHYYPDYGYKMDSYSIDENKLDDFNDDINTVQQRLDSIKREKTNYIQGFESYSGWSGGFVGLVTPISLKSLGHNRASSVQYLKLSKIGLEIQGQPGPNYLAYYSRNGNGYLSKTKLITKGNHHTVSYLDKKVNYNYSADDNAILILVQSSFWKFCIQAFILLTIVLFIAPNLFLLKLFIQFLLAISKNNGFEEVNVNRLKIISTTLLILGCVNYVISMIIYGIFCLSHPNDGVVITHSFWEQDYIMIILSALSYLIYTAFKKAMLLQQEQDLTI
jgi:uncharacterized membrane protein